MKEIFINVYDNCVCFWAGDYSGSDPVGENTTKETVLGELVKRFSSPEVFGDVSFRIEFVS